MLNPVECTSEHHSFGGDGVVFSGRAEALLPRLRDEYGGRIQLIYLDPPFGTGGSFEYRDRTITHAYSDKLGSKERLELMRTVLLGCRELLCDSGSIYVHVDYRMSAAIRMIMDEIFGANNLMNELIWVYKSGGRATRFYPRKHDVILFYRKTRKVFFNIAAAGVPRGTERRNHMRRRVDDDGRIYFSIRTNGREYRYYEDDLVYPSDVWSDIEHLHQRDPERTGYATQKPEALLKRIILTSSREGDTVADLFGGSGTTAAAAARLGRRFVSVDCSKASLLVTRRRLLSASNEQNILRANRPLDIRFGADHSLAPSDARELFESEPIIGGVHIEASGGERTPAYAAVGKMLGGVFMPREYLLRPSEGAGLTVWEGETLHIVDSNCNQGFFNFSIG